MVLEEVRESLDLSPYERQAHTVVKEGKEKEEQQGKVSTRVVWSD